MKKISLSWCIVLFLIFLSFAGRGQNQAFYLLSPERQTVVLWMAVEYLREDIKTVTAKLDMISTALAETREEIAEMRGRQSVTIGAATATPTGLAGLIFWWLRRERKRNQKRAENE